MKLTISSLFLILGAFLILSFVDIIWAKKYYRPNASDKHMPAKIKSTGVRTFVFSPRYRRWAVYDANGNRVSHGVANGGAHYCRDVGRSCRTPRGTFRVISKRGPNCRSSRYPIKRVRGRIVRGGAPMPYCTFFSKDYGIHGYPKLVNANVSHGCIRVSIKAARWLQNYLPIGAKVIVWSY